MTRTTTARAFLALTAVLFVAWIGWLAYQVVTLRRELAAGQGRPLVLSRPQLLVATLVVTAEVEAREGKPATALVKEVHWPDNEQTRKLVGQRIEVTNLAASEGLGGAGAYLLPLLAGDGSYRVAPTPPSPGYPPGGARAGPPRIYPDTPHVRAELARVREP